MTTDLNLTQGSIMTMCHDNFTSDELKPVLQVIHLKPVQMQQNTAARKYRVVLSDGSHYQQGMLATCKNKLADSGKLQEGSIVRLTQFVCNHVVDRMIIIIVELEILKEKCDLIGKPVLAPKCRVIIMMDYPKDASTWIKKCKIAKFISFFYYDINLIKLVVFLYSSMGIFLLMKFLFLYFDSFKF